MRNIFKKYALTVFVIYFMTGCSTPAQRAEREISERQKIMEKIQPIGTSVRNLTKQESYAACDQKSEAFALEAEKMEEVKQSIESRKSSGGFAAGLSQGMASWSAKKNAKKIALKSCLIDYGYIMK